MHPVIGMQCHCHLGYTGEWVKQFMEQACDCYLLQVSLLQSTDFKEFVLLILNKSFKTIFFHIMLKLWLGIVAAVL